MTILMRLLLIPRKSRLVLRLAAVVLIGGATYLVTSRPSLPGSGRASSELKVVLGLLTVAAFWWCMRGWIDYRRYGVVRSMDRRLRSLANRMRPGEVVQLGPVVVYRARFNERRERWCGLRLWLVHPNAVLEIPVGQAQALAARIVWFHPGSSEILFARDNFQIYHSKETKFVPRPPHEPLVVWQRYFDMDAAEKERFLTPPDSISKSHRP